MNTWTLPDIEAALDALKNRKPDLARGRDIYTQAQCTQCHLFRDAGGNALIQPCMWMASQCQ